MKLILLIIAICSYSNVSFAASNEANLLNRLLLLSEQSQPVKAKEYLTLSSHDVFDRLYKNDLTHLIPSKVSEIKSDQRNGYNYVWFTNDLSSNSSSILAFKNENNLLKLDLPETFLVGLGKDWENKLNLIEQSYLLAKKYYGEDKSKEILEALLKQE